MIPPLCMLGFALACGRAEPPPEADTAALPFDATPLPAGEQRLVSAAGDTLRVVTLPPEGGRQLLVTTRTGRSDSTAVLIDATTKAPVESYRRASAGTSDTVTARVEYGRGFERQARLTLTAGQGRAAENLRTPPPSLDAGQLPLTFAAFPEEPDTIHLNYVAPFEKRALAALVVIGPRETLRIGGASIAARPVRLQVSGLDERAWFAVDPPHDLLRFEERTRGRTWTRLP
jgi:hypothetical protein